ncbi:hypothetical protein CHS0354_021665 [Potamilus streckersoni]|uniref:Uncharacterized protein n=1 Tax=Potamilus streckersoni TaxID=2493646 RepID=A0AAE0SPZ7_9BIVA|nr:hypothetical protein CHS0354_021665 [Potamilus streckersoni]
MQVFDIYTTFAKPLPTNPRQRKYNSILLYLAGQSTKFGITTVDIVSKLYQVWNTKKMLKARQRKPYVTGAKAALLLFESTRLGHKQYCYYSSLQDWDKKNSTATIQDWYYGSIVNPESTGHGQTQHFYSSSIYDWDKYIITSLQYKELGQKQHRYFSRIQDWTKISTAHLGVYRTGTKATLLLFQYTGLDQHRIATLQVYRTGTKTVLLLFKNTGHCYSSSLHVVDKNNIATRRVYWTGANKIIATLKVYRTGTTPSLIHFRSTD